MREADSRHADVIARETRVWINLTDRVTVNEPHCPVPACFGWEMDNHVDQVR
jgi:hypothetical protein